MAVESVMLPLGTPVPDFKLRSIDGELVGPSDYADAPALLVMFLCNHCPYVRHIEAKLAEVVRDHQPRGLAALAICSNDTDAYPDDGPEGLREQARRAGFTFPYLVDDTQEVARALRAACTPDFFLFDRDRRLAYRGRFDGSRPHSPAPVTGEDLKDALEAVLAGRSVEGEQLPSLGCSIKWKAGNDPQG